MKLEWLVLSLFCLSLLLCLMLDLSILYALLAGLLLFLMYGKHRGFSWRELLHMAFDGVWTIRNILFTFLLIGVLTALWRMAGTIPVIVCSASSLIHPSVFLLMTFLLNCAVSFLTGTSLGTASTMGVLCSMLGRTMGISLPALGGAVLSGAFFGDRCSPVSTSALLVSELTGTDIFGNIRRMFRTAFVPFVLTCVLYALLGLRVGQMETLPDLRSLFEKEFILDSLALIPAGVILLLSMLYLNVRLTMAASILTALPLCLILQGASLPELLKTAVFGFQASDGELAGMINGGGVLSMLRVGGIVCLSASYSGIFRRTGLLDGVKHSIETLSKNTTPFLAILVTSCAASVLSCNQTLAVMLTHQLCGTLKDDPSDLALDLEDTAIVVSPLVPWSIAGGVPLAVIGAPSGAVFWAFYLCLLPLWRLAGSLREKASRPEP